MIKFNNAAIALATAILRDYLNGTANFFASRKAAKSELTKLTPTDFKNVRANLLNLGFKSEFIDENVAELSEILRGILTTERPKLPKDHPIATYIDENDAARELIAKAKELLKNLSKTNGLKFTTNQAALTGRTLPENSTNSTRCSKTRALTARRASCGTLIIRSVTVSPQRASC